MNQVIMWILAIGAVVGGIDRMFGNRLKLGPKFTEGFELLGVTALSMAGILCLAPVLANVIASTVAPLLARTGLDPACFGCVLANDMGGLELASTLANDANVGRFYGYLVTAMLGCTISFTIPVGMGMAKGEARNDFARGLLYGLVGMPAALITGGLLCGMTLAQTIFQSLPVLTLSVLLLLGLWKATDAMIKGFSVFAKVIQVITLIGLILGAFEYMTELHIVPGLGRIEDAMSVVSSIGIVLCGSLPVAELLTRVLKKPFEAIGRRTGMNGHSMTGLLITIVSSLPMMAALNDMDSRGRTLCGAFTVCATAVIGAHLGFTAGHDTSMITPLIVTKLVGGLTGITIAAICTRKKH